MLSNVRVLQLLKDALMLKYCLEILDKDYIFCYHTALQFFLNYLAAFLLLHLLNMLINVT